MSKSFQYIDFSVFSLNQDLSGRFFRVNPCCVHLFPYTEDWKGLPKYKEVVFGLHRNEFNESLSLTLIANPVSGELLYLTYTPTLSRRILPLLQEAVWFDKPEEVSPETEPLKRDLRNSLIGRTFKGMPIRKRKGSSNKVMLEQVALTECYVSKVSGRFIYGIPLDGDFKGEVFIFSFSEVMFYHEGQLNPEAKPSVGFYHALVGEL